MTSPLEIEIALHYHTTPGDFRDGDFSAPAVKAVIDDFLARGLLEPRACSDENRHPRKFDPTRGLEMYVGALCEVPYPCQIWHFPEE